MKLLSTIADEERRRWEFKQKSGNESFLASVMTYITLFLLVIAYPAVNIAFTEDPTAFLKGLNESVRLVLFVSTMIMQWGIFLLVFMSCYLEKTSLRGIGLKRLRLVDFAWAIAFLLASIAVLSLVAKFLAWMGLPMSGEIGLLVPESVLGKILWVMLSITAGFCEETAFRGYMMTRIRLAAKLPSWVIPTILSAVVFGACHAYQGVPGFIIISVYGILFSLLYIRTGTLWPGIIAHSLQDLGNLFLPR